MKSRSKHPEFKAAIFLLICLGLSLQSCTETAYTPKPKAYPHIEFPTKGYQKHQQNDCPFTFEYPKYGNIVKDTHFFGEKVENPCWMNIELPYFNARVYMSYKVITQKDNFAKLVEDSYKMTTKHVVKADYIDDKPIATKSGAHGMLYEVGGDAASPTQFFLSDSTNHFLRGALYFDHTPNRDSLDIVINFLQADIAHFLDTFHWK